MQTLVVEILYYTYNPSSSSLERKALTNYGLVNA